ncbi:glycosyltransferase [Clostridium perfringens]|uniref:glycosyltransferase n=1 Tax=Clostridium perfringens TaxID=1502 RepID=UPI0006683889|nr:glycosyltransferase [Clostridium perfringens]MDK0671362.1 glycosyltransferase [Clostridium perfringens]
MKILHCCISAFYIDKYNYQENILPKQNKIDGNEVQIFASTYTFKNNDNKKSDYIKPTDYINEDNIIVKRRNYKKIISRFLTNKIRKIDGFYEMIEEFSPDVILFHGTSSVEILTAAKYKMKHPNVKLYMDSHADYYTSGTNIISRKILHGIFYKYYIHKSLPYIDKVLYVSTGCGDFLREVYKVPEEKIEFYSLGGNIPTKDEIKESRKVVCKELNIKNDNIIFLQAGKLDCNKKVVEMLETFSKIKDDRFIFLLIGSISNDIEKNLKELIGNDKRVKYLGWKNGDELNTYLNACDVYLQPGKVSATAQNAICRSSAVLLSNLKEYKIFVKDNGWLVNDFKEVENILKDISENKVDIVKMKGISNIIGNKYFDYKKLAARLYK